MRKANVLVIADPADVEFFDTALPSKQWSIFLKIVDYERLYKSARELRDAVNQHAIDFLAFSRNDQVCSRVATAPMVEKLRTGYTTFSGIDDAKRSEQMAQCFEDFVKCDKILRYDGTGVSRTGLGNTQRERTFSLVFDLEQVGGVKRNTDFREGETVSGGALLNNDSSVRPRVAIVSFPWAAKAPYKLLSELVQILEPIAERIVLIDGNTERITMSSEKVELRDIAISMHYLGDVKPKHFSAVLWILKWFLFQCRASLELARARAEVDVVIFYLAYPGYLLPLVVTKLLRKMSIEVITRGKATSTKARLWGLQDPILFTLLDGISPESRGLIKELDLEKYGQKVLPEGARFIDDRCYKKNKRLSERANVVGFAGRMVREKGIVDFVRAIPLAAEEVSDLKFSIIGSGPLSGWVNEQSNQLITERGINITYTDWIETSLADYYNELKLFVLPTYYDAFPTSILEAMACGTPVLTTSVGAIPDVITNEVTGFLLESTRPEHIAQRIMTILNYRELEKVADNAEGLIRQKFTRVAAIERYDKMLNEVLVQRNHF